MIIHQNGKDQAKRYIKISSEKDEMLKENVQEILVSPELWIIESQK